MPSLQEPSPFLPRVLSDFEAEDSNELPAMTTMVPEEVAVITPAPAPVVKKVCDLKNEVI